MPGDVHVLFLLSAASAYFCRPRGFGHVQQLRDANPLVFVNYMHGIVTKRTNMPRTSSRFVVFSFLHRTMSTSMKKPSTLLVGLPVTDRTPIKTPWSNMPVSIADEIEQITKELVAEGYDFAYIG